MLIFITIILFIILVLIILIIVLLFKQKDSMELLTKTPVIPIGPYLQPINSPFQSLSFEEAYSITPLLDNMIKVADQNAVNLINTQFGADILISGTNSISHVKKGEYIVSFSKEGQSMLNASKVSLIKCKDGSVVTTLIGKDGKIIESARLIEKSQKLLSTISKLSTIVVSSAHIISGADNAKKLREISKDIKFLIQARKNEQLGKLEAIYKHAKELLAHGLTPETYMALFNLSKDIHELRSTWRRDIDYKLSNIDDPENRSWFKKFFSRTKTTDKNITSNISNCEEDLILIEFSLLLHISIFEAIGESDIFLSLSLPDEIKQFRTTLSLLNEKHNYLSAKHIEITANETINYFDGVLKRSETFVSALSKT